MKRNQHEQQKYSYCQLVKISIRKAFLQLLNKYFKQDHKLKKLINKTKRKLGKIVLDNTDLKK